MIFVTVGSTHFNALVEEIDNLSGRDFFEEEVICQIGSGTYHPTNCKYFKHAESLVEYYNESSFVFTHGGSTVLELLAIGVPFAAIANKDLAGNHQEFFLSDIKDRYNIMKADDIGQLSEMYQRYRNGGYQSSYKRSGALFTYLANLL